MSLPNSTPTSHLSRTLEALQIDSSEPPKPLRKQDPPDLSYRDQVYNESLDGLTSDEEREQESEDSLSKEDNQGANEGSVSHATTLHNTRSKMNIEIRKFRGARDGRERPEHLLDDIELVVEYNFRDLNEGEKNRMRKRLFRTNLRNLDDPNKAGAQDWYDDLEPEVQDDWANLEKEFIKEYKVSKTSIDDLKSKYTFAVARMSQGTEEPVREYLERADKLYAEGGKILDSLQYAHHIVEGLNHCSKKVQMQFNIESNQGTKRDLKYPEVRKLIKLLYEVDDKTAKPETQAMDVEILTQSFMRAFASHLGKTSQPTYDPAPPPPPPFVPPPSYAPPKPASNPYSYTPNYQNQNAQWITCRNCMEKGHYQYDCPKPLVSKEQLAANQLEIDQRKAIYAKDSWRSRQQQQQRPANSNQQQPVAVTSNAVLSHVHGPQQYGPNADQPEFDEQVHPCYEPYDPSGPVPLKCALPGEPIYEGSVVAMAGTTARRTRSGSQSSMGTASRPGGIVKRTSGKNPTPIAQRVQENVDPLHVPERSQTLTPEPQGYEPADHQMFDAEPTPGSRQSDRHVTFDASAQGATPAPGKVLIPKKEFKYPTPIRAVEQIDRFDIAKLLQTPIAMNIGQFLDFSEPARKALALQMQTSKPSYRRSRKAAAPSATLASVQLADTTADETAPAMVVAPIFVSTQISGTAGTTGILAMPDTLLDGGSMVEIIDRKKAVNLGAVIHGDGSVPVTLADGRHVTLTEYAFVTVNLSGVRANIKAYILNNLAGYQLLLGLPFMAKVRMVISYHDHHITLRGLDNITRTVKSRYAPQEIIEQIPRVVDLGEDEEEGSDTEDLLQNVIDEPYQSGKEEHRWN